MEQRYSRTPFVTSSTLQPRRAFLARLWRAPQPSQDAPTNIANLAMFKNIKLNERASLEFNTTFQNVLNHPNFQSIDPNIEDAGLTKSQQAPFVGFADPSVTNTLWATLWEPALFALDLLSGSNLLQVASLPAGVQIRRVFYCLDQMLHSEQHCCA